MSSLCRNLHFDLCFRGWQWGEAGSVTCTWARSGVQGGVGRLLLLPVTKKGLFFGPKKQEKLETQIRASPVQDSRRGSWDFAHMAACKASAYLINKGAKNRPVRRDHLRSWEGPLLDSFWNTFPLRKGPKLSSQHSESGPHSNTFLHRVVEI